eukprot:PhM_4_TR16454/c1_g1_i1/m.95200
MIMRKHPSKIPPIFIVVGVVAYTILFCAIASAASLSPAPPPVAWARICTTEHYDPALIVCPNEFKMTTDNTDSEIDRRTEWIVRKYKYYAERCQKTDGMMWKQLSKSTHDRIATLIGHVVGLKPKATVLDWACGCGVSMEYLHRNFHTSRVIGVDLTAGAIAYAKEKYGGLSPSLLFCHADGTILDWIPPNSVDHVLSFGGLLHLPRAMICPALTQLLRITRPGGVVWAGYIDNAETVSLMKSCAFDPCLGVNLTTVDENTLFKNYGVPKANRKRKPISLFWVKQGTLPADPIEVRKKLEEQ